MAEHPPTKEEILTHSETHEHQLPEFLLLARAKERLAVDKARKAVAKVKHAIEKAAPYPGSD